MPWSKYINLVFYLNKLTIVTRMLKNTWFEYYRRETALGRDLHDENEPHRTVRFRLTLLYKVKGQLKSHALNAMYKVFMEKYSTIL